jgi:hypothetical protein
MSAWLKALLMNFSPPVRYSASLCFLTQSKNVYIASLDIALV